MLKKLIASASAAAVALSTLTSGLAMGAPVVTDPELMDAVSWAYDAGLTKYSNADAFMAYNNLTREQFAKFASQFGSSVLDLQADTSKDCSYSDESSSDSSLVPFIKQACEMGLMMGYAGNFMPKQLVTRGQVATVLGRMLGGIDAMSSEQAFFDYLNSLGVMKVSNLNTAMTRGDALLTLYRVANGSNTDLCTIDPTLPGCTNNGTGSTNTGSTNTGTQVKEGDLQISMNPTSLANYTSIPKLGVATFASVDFTAGAKDITINNIQLVRSGLGNYTDVRGVYFESAGVKVTSRSTVSSDNTAAVSFSPAIVIPAGKTVTLDLVVEMSGAAGGEHMFTSTVIDSSAATVNGKIMTNTLRTADYAVRGVTFTNQSTATTYNGNEASVELGKFQLQNNGGATTIDAKVQSITLRNAGNSNLTSLSNLTLYRGGVAVSTKAIVSGRDVTFVLNDTVKDGQSAIYTVMGTVNNVDNAGGDTYKFVLRQATDINSKESTTMFRNAITITSSLNNDASNTVAGVYQVNGGELRFSQDTSALNQLSVSPGSLQVVLMKGTISAKQAILLEDITLPILQGTSTVADFATKYTLTINNSSFTWTPTNGATSALFQGSTTVNGTVNVQLVADVRSNVLANTKVQFGNLGSSAFARKEYVSTQNSVNSAIGTIAGRIVTVVNSVLNVSRNDGLTNVKATTNSNGKVLYGIRLTNNGNNDVKVGSITLSPTSGSLNNDVSIDLKNGSTILASRTLNGDTVFNGLNIVVKNGTPVDLTFVGNFLSTATIGESTQFAVKFNAGDAIDNTTANNVLVGGVPAGTALATSTSTTIIGGGTVQVTSNISNTPAKGFVVPSSTKVKVGSINVQAINDTLELEGIYLKIQGSGAYAAQVGQQLSSFELRDGANVYGETTREGANSDIVGFEISTNRPQIPVGTKAFDVYAMVNDVTSATSAGEFTVAIATGYTNPQHLDIYQGVRLNSVNAGTDVVGTSVTSSVIGNSYYVVASYPKFAQLTANNSNTEIMNFTVTNQSSLNITKINSVSYTANSPTFATEWAGKIVNIENNGTIVASGVVAANGTLTFSTPVSISPSTTVTFNVKMDSTTPFAPASVSGTRTRTFSIIDASFDQVYSDATTSTIASVAAYKTSVGLDLTQSRTY